MMPNILGLTLLVACVPVIPALFRTLGPRAGSILGIFGGFLLITRYGFPDLVFGLFRVDKLTMPGFSLLLALLLFGRPALLGFRPHWFDLPMLVSIILPLVIKGVFGVGDFRAAFDQSFVEAMLWGVPYLLGRLYFGEILGLRGLAVAFVSAALLYIPPCIYEFIVGPQYFIRPILFGIPTIEGMVNRLGGWRPEVCLSNGIELALFMAMATILAAWLGISRASKKPLGLPAWVAFGLLLATTIGCRGAYGYATLAVGLVATGLLLVDRSRTILIVLGLVPLVYLGLRMTGFWDGLSLPRMAGWVDSRSAGSIAIRISQENDYLKDVLRGSLAIGLGSRFDDRADGWWIYLLRSGGLVSVGAHYLAFLLPAALVGLRRPFPPIRSSIEPGLALILVLGVIDSLHNWSYFSAIPLIGGGLTSYFLRGRPSPPGTDRESSRVGTGHRTYRVGAIADPAEARSAPEPDFPWRGYLIRLILIALALAAPELVGRLPFPIGSGMATRP